MGTTKIGSYTARFVSSDTYGREVCVTLSAGKWSATRAPRSGVGARIASPNFATLAELEGWLTVERVTLMSPWVKLCERDDTEPREPYSYGIGGAL